MKRFTEFKILNNPDAFEILNNEKLASNLWDNIFFRGELNEETAKKIRCIIQCTGCYLNWFELNLTDIEKNSLLSWVGENSHRSSFVENNKLAIYKDHGYGLKSYTTHLGCQANAVWIECNRCKFQFLVIAGITETQPGLYAGQYQGIWKIKI